MWGRIVEFMLACWLAISSFIFGYSQDMHFFWINDLVISVCIAFFSLVSFYKPLRKMHLCNVGISLYLMVLSYMFQSHPLYSLSQNYMVLGLLFFMIALVPSDSTLPPIPWQDFYKTTSSKKDRPTKE